MLNRIHTFVNGEKQSLLLDTIRHDHKQKNSRLQACRVACSVLQSMQKVRLSKQERSLSRLRDVCSDSGSDSDR
jgi:hypothetical protein